MARFDGGRVAPLEWVGVAAGALALVDGFLSWRHVKGSPEVVDLLRTLGVKTWYTAWGSGVTGWLPVLLLAGAGALILAPGFGLRVRGVPVLWLAMAAAALVLILIRWATLPTPDAALLRARNHWIVDRGDGRPSVNLVVLSFVHPVKLLNLTTDSTTLNGIPRGFTPELVGYFTARGIRVQLSIGGITYVDPWNQALAANAAQLGRNAADVARRLGVGIEIDYEENSGPNLAGLQAFIDAYRAVLPYDASGANPAARLTIDVAAGDRWLIDLNRKATADWLRPDAPVLDYANAMVPARQPSTSGAIANWQEHIDGKPQYSPPVPPLAPAKFTGGLYIAEGGKVRPECNDFAASLQNSTGSWLQNAAPNGAGSTAGLLGYMFWAAERPSTRGVTTTPPNTCEGGVGAGATAYAIPVPMPALRQS